MKYLKKFQEEIEYLEYCSSDNFVEPNLSLITELGEMRFNDDRPYHDYSQDYLTFNIISAGTINWETNSDSFAKTISYSKDSGTTWTNITSSTGGTNINVNAGDKVMFKGDNENYGGSSANYNKFSDSAAIFEIEGNIMSLVNSTGFTTATTLQSDYTFYELFKYCSVTSAKNLVLPATTLAQYCYREMFGNCKRLTTAPELPATTLASNCYYHMFQDCSGLTTAPELPATTLAQGCYSGMFYSCTSLTTAPELPATTLAQSCYISMFYGCSSLNYIKCLATDISATICTYDWVYNVASSGTFVKDANMSSWTTGDSGIPSNWTVQDDS